MKKKIFTEYDKEIIDILHDMNIVNDRFDDSIIGYNRLPGTIGPSASNVSRKSLNSSTLVSSPTMKGNPVNRAHDGRSRSLYIAPNDYK